MPTRCKDNNYLWNQQTIQEKSDGMQVCSVDDEQNGA
jgi:hypothetical protein